MASTKTCPFDRRGCSDSCLSFVPDPSDVGDGKTDLTPANCAVLAGLSAIAKIGTMFDPELVGSMDGIMKLLVPNVLTRKAGQSGGLFRRKPPKPSTEGSGS